MPLNVLTVGPLPCDSVSQAQNWHLARDSDFGPASYGGPLHPHLLKRTGSRARERSGGPINFKTLRLTHNAGLAFIIRTWHDITNLMPCRFSYLLDLATSLASGLRSLQLQARSRESSSSRSSTVAMKVSRTRNRVWRGPEP